MLVFELFWLIIVLSLINKGELLLNEVLKFLFTFNNNLFEYKILPLFFFLIIFLLLIGLDVVFDILFLDINFLILFFLFKLLILFLFKYLFLIFDFNSLLKLFIFF